MARYILGRLLKMVPIVLGITLLTFLLTRLSPGDPAKNALGIYATPERIAAYRQEFGLDQPLFDQYVVYLLKLLQGDLGYSYYYRQSALDLVLGRLGPEIVLISYAIVLSLAIGVPLAVAAGLRRGGTIDRLVSSSIVVSYSLPAFWVGIILLLVLAVWIPIFPVGGFGEGLLGPPRSLFLPALTIAFSLLPLIIRALRASVIETSGLDYVDMARSKGLSERRVTTRHVLRSALIPTATIIGINIGFLVSGTVVIENVYGVPGLGQLMVNSIYTRDYPVIQATAFVLAILVVLVNLGTDVVVAFLDPRARAGLAGS
jgi:peptide/nickel transport system permease protein